MRLDSSASSLQCGRPVPTRVQQYCTVWEWQQRLKDSCSSRVRKVGKQREQASEQSVWPDLKEPCSAITYKICHKVTLLKYWGLRKLAAASCHCSRINTTMQDRKALKKHSKVTYWGTRENAADIAIGESEGENCLSTHSCTTDFIQYKLIMWQEATNKYETSFTLR